MLGFLFILVLYFVDKLHRLTCHDADAVRLLVALYHLMAALHLLLEGRQVVLKTSWWF